jgi:NAD+ diphosphatase
MTAFVFFGDRLLLEEAAGTMRLPTEARVREVLSVRHLEAGRLRPGDTTFELPEATRLPAGFRLSGLRAAHGHLSEADFRAAGTARQRVEWMRTHTFCSRCGQPNALCDRGESMTCGSCGQSHFARVAPAVIVLVERGSEILLGRSARFKPGVYSTLAGFVEPGESLEECVHREIAEEVGVRVRNLRYFGSQPHPFPNSLMVGFTAEWASGDIVPDNDEIEDAQWFSREALPDLPHEMSIAWALIQDWLIRTDREPSG